jgi:hypothetical protein
MLFLSQQRVPSPDYDEFTEAYDRAMYACIGSLVYDGTIAPDQLTFQLVWDIHNVIFTGA